MGRRVSDPTSPQFLSTTDIEAAVNYSRPLELPPQSGFRYRAFCDASRRPTRSLRRRHRPQAGRIAGHRLPCVGAHRHSIPKPSPRSWPTSSRATASARSLATTTSAAWTEQAWNKTGVRYKRSEINKSQIYLETLVSFTRNICSLPNHPQADQGTAAARTPRASLRQGHGRSRRPRHGRLQPTQLAARCICSAAQVTAAIWTPWPMLYPTNQRCRRHVIPPSSRRNMIHRIMQPVALIPQKREDAA